MTWDGQGQQVDKDARTFDLQPGLSNPSDTAMKGRLIQAQHGSVLSGGLILQDNAVAFQLQCSGSAC